MSGFASAAASVANGIGTVANIASILTGSGPVTLDDFVFQQFEVPEVITWGGAQALVVHKYPGGERDIDSMGRDDRDLDWAGVFLGPGSEQRALQLDAKRAAGNVLQLTFGTQLFLVVIRNFDADYRRPYWLPYRISCTVLQDQSAAPAQNPGLLADLTTGDLSGAVSSIQGTLTTVQSVVTAASPFLPAKTLAAINSVTGAASTALGATSGALSLATSAGSFAFGAATSLAAETGASGASSSILSGVAAAGSDIATVTSAAPSAGIVASASELIHAVSSTGILAGLTQAAGLAGRASTNIANGQP